LDSKNTWIGLTPGVLALLGGYSSEAVENVLQRIVDILLAIIRGDASADTNAKVAAAKVTADVQIRNSNADLRNDLIDIRSAVPGASQDPKPLNSALNAMDAKLKGVRSGPNVRASGT
jgi:hypothetical protein